MSFSLLEVIAIFGVVLFLFFGFYLLKVETNKKLTNTLLAIYFFVIALDCSSFFYHKFLSFPYWLEILRMEGLAGLKSPLFYLYILSLLYENFKLKKIHLLFFTPMLLKFLILIPSFFLKDIEGQRTFLYNYYDQPESIFFNVMGWGEAFIVYFASFYQLYRYKAIIKQNYTNANSLINYNWLKKYLWICVVSTLIAFIKTNYRFMDGDIQVTINLIIFMLVSMILYVSWMFSKALFAPQIFQGINSNLVTEGEKLDEFKSENCAEENLKTDARVAIILNWMESEKPYLEPDLTVQKLATQLDMSARELSEVLNKELDKHFFDFVNEYRIKEAMKMLTDSGKKKYRIQEIMYDVGFNSKTPFNTAFKKYTSQTPSQYRNSAEIQSVV
ncbi:helix-turn-helix domain-containing protein [Aureibacter tunicatorum]|uniref:AraC-like DNA-binding protein n=1 Tax=Aureibacter tunicatorum TaxID=866807 RepID=A0AAE4BSI7_9BACT|nr:helix-turn-helix domain-containing protein [Aureibacter tunicatorum]MDR6238885.1 AraC-like DNA-binding protein [Aureibacter tunicatorum]BDD05188.1 transcriptional regulator [Aureibacter tunicatorum]